jgi:hypothetical protein
VKDILTIVLVCVFGFLSTSQSLAATYKFEYKDDMQSIPAEYRAPPKIVSGETRKKSQIDLLNRMIPLTQSGIIASQRRLPMSGIPFCKKDGGPAETNPFGLRMFAFIILGILDTDHKRLCS